MKGNHRLIERFRRNESIRKTFENRPELLEKIEFDNDDLKYIDELREKKESD